MEKELATRINKIELRKIEEDLELIERDMDSMAEEESKLDDSQVS